MSIEPFISCEKALKTLCFASRVFACHSCENQVSNRGNKNKCTFIQERIKNHLEQHCWPTSSNIISREWRPRTRKGSNTQKTHSMPNSTIKCVIVLCYLLFSQSEMSRIKIENKSINGKNRTPWNIFCKRYSRYTSEQKTNPFKNQQYPHCRHVIISTTKLAFPIWIVCERWRKTHTHVQIHRKHWSLLYHNSIP